MRNSGVRRINNAVCRLDWVLVENVLNPPDGSDGAPFELCAATLYDWNLYIQSAHQALGLRWGALHEILVRDVRDAITEATGTSRAHLTYNGAAYIDNCVNLSDDINALIAFLEPDDSFGPFQGLPGAILPEGFSWPKFHALKVEIGVAQGWGPPIQQQGQDGQHGQAGQQRQPGRRRVVTLNEKADAWRYCPGVEYVLSIRISPGLRPREYRLFSIVNRQFEEPVVNQLPIDNNTVVTFDPWRLLGIPPDANLPAGFNNPVEFNLFDVVDPILQREPENVALERAAVAAAAAAAAADDDDDDDDDDAGQPPRRRQRRH